MVAPASWTGRQPFALGRKARGTALAARRRSPLPLAQSASRVALGRRGLSGQVQGGEGHGRACGEHDGERFRIRAGIKLHGPRDVAGRPAHRHDLGDPRGEVGRDRQRERKIGDRTEADQRQWRACATEVGEKCCSCSGRRGRRAGLQKRPAREPLAAMCARSVQGRSSERSLGARVDRRPTLRHRDHRVRVGGGVFETDIGGGRQNGPDIQLGWRQRQPRQRVVDARVGRGNHRTLRGRHNYWKPVLPRIKTRHVRPRSSRDVITAEWTSCGF